MKVVEVLELTSRLHALNNSRTTATCISRTLLGYNYFYLNILNKQWFAQNKMRRPLWQIQTSHFHNRLHPTLSLSHPYDTIRYDREVKAEYSALSSTLVASVA